MTKHQPADFDITYEVTRFVVKVRTRTLSQLSRIHPDLEYGNFLFFLAICDAPDGIRATALAEHFGVHKSTVSRAVTQLDSMDLIRRSPDPQDGRAQLLVAQPEAVKAVSELRVEGRQWLAALLSDWSDEEVSQFRANLARFNDAADQAP